LSIPARQPDAGRSPPVRTEPRGGYPSRRGLVGRPRRVAAGSATRSFARCATMRPLGP